jgi:glycosyltransferase involved in cell wall biosynthesis
MTRILLVTGSFPPMTCGVGDYTRALAQALAAHPALAIGVLTSTEADPAAAPGCEVFPVIRSWTRADLGAARAAVERWRPDVVHFQFPTQGYRGDLAWQLPPLLRASGRPVVQTWHESVAARSGGWTAAMRPTLAEKLRTAIPQVILSLTPGEIVVVRPEFESRMPWWYRLFGLPGRLRLIPNASTIPRVTLAPAEAVEVRARYGAGGRALLAFFGFMHERKGVDDLLALLDPERHHLVMVGEVNETDPYQRDLLRRLREPPLARHVTLAGFLPADEAARVLAVADAVVLPYRDGAGSFNTTLKAAIGQGTFVLTTSTERRGFDPEQNVFFAKPRDVAEMKIALAQHLGRRSVAPPQELVGPTWPEIAERHLEVYRRAAGGPARRSGG